jgi:hypothetical protein
MHVKMQTQVQSKSNLHITTLAVLYKLIVTYITLYYYQYLSIANSK